MKATQPIRRQVLCAMSAVALSVIMLTSVSCTKKMNGNADTTTGTATETTATTKPETKPETKHETAKPLDPEAGTVESDSDPSTPPAGTDDGTDTRHRIRFMR